jgi:2-polyprenyl-3-methyl-5-hydroxy-6-metoxy-1,4-benzoquinol methylase
MDFDNARLVGCAVCGSWTRLPRSSSQEQAAIHDKIDYFDHPYFEGRRSVTRAIDRRCVESFGRIGAAINLRSLRGKRLLDVGCDTGLFLASAAKHFGIIPVGIDVSRHAVMAAARHGIEVHHTDLEVAPEHLNDFSVITAIDVIEHVTNPRAFLQEIRRRLRPGGVTYLETPNIRSIIYRLAHILYRITAGRPQQTFDRLFPPQHAQYFTCKGLTALAHDSGLEVIDLDTRILYFSDIATSLPVRLVLMSLQLLDRLTREKILICALLRRPGGNEHGSPV